MRQTPDSFSSSELMAPVNAQPSRPAVARDGDTPLMGLAGSQLAGRFRYWRGLSGRRYLFSVFALPSRCWLERVPRYEQTVVLAVRLDEAGTRTILLAADTGSMPDIVFDGGLLRDSIAAGANEIHMHLLAEDAASRSAIVADLASPPGPSYAAG